MCDSSTGPHITLTMKDRFDRDLHKSLCIGLRVQFEFWWVQHTDPTLPRGDRFMAVGHYMDPIYMSYVHCHHIPSLWMTWKCICCESSLIDSYGYRQWWQSKFPCSCILENVASLTWDNNSTIHLRHEKQTFLSVGISQKKQHGDLWVLIWSSTMMNLETHSLIKRSSPLDRAAHFKTGSIFIVYNRILRILNVSKIDFKISVTKSLNRTPSF